MQLLAAEGGFSSTVETKWEDKINILFTFVTGVCLKKLLFVNKFVQLTSCLQFFPTALNVLYDYCNLKQDCDTFKRCRYFV